MGDSEQKGTAYMAEAQKKLQSSKGFLGSLFGGSNKQEEAAELYIRAANSFKMAKNWSAAGNAFTESAKLHTRMGSRHESASNYVDASTCYKKTDPNEAIECLVKAVEIYTDMGRFAQAAKHHVTIAEVYESELANMEEAIKNYEQAADYYKGEESTSHANKCLLKVAQYSAQIEAYDKAIEIYEQIGTASMDNSLLKYAAKDHFWRAGLCRLCVDLLDAQQSVQKYCDMFPAFSDSRECKLLKTVMQAMEESNVDAFTEAVNEYDQIKRLEPWETTLLLRAKKTIEDEGDLR